MKWYRAAVFAPSRSGQTTTAGSRWASRDQVGHGKRRRSPGRLGRRRHLRHSLPRGTPIARVFGGRASAPPSSLI